MVRARQQVAEEMLQVQVLRQQVMVEKQEVKKLEAQNWTVHSRITQQEAKLEQAQQVMRMKEKSVADREQQVVALENLRRRNRCARMWQDICVVLTL